MSKDKKQTVPVSIYIDVGLKEEMEEVFLDCRYKKQQDGYRECLLLGFEQLKKNKQKEKK